MPLGFCTGAPGISTGAPADDSYGAGQYIGLGGCNTLGSREVPLGFKLGSGQYAIGRSKSNELDTANDYMLLSLFAHSQLGLIKDAAAATCYMRGYASYLQFYEIKSNGLRAICINEFVKDDYQPVNIIAHTRLNWTGAIPASQHRMQLPAKLRKAVGNHWNATILPLIQETEQEGSDPDSPLLVSSIGYSPCAFLEEEEEDIHPKEHASAFSPTLLSVFGGAEGRHSRFDPDPGRTQFADPDPGRMQCVDPDPGRASCDVPDPGRASFSNAATFPTAEWYSIAIVCSPSDIADQEEKWEHRVSDNND